MLRSQGFYTFANVFGDGSANFEAENEGVGIFW